MHSQKVLSQTSKSQNNFDPLDPKKRYLLHNKQERQQERQKVQAKDRNKKKYEQNVHMKLLIHEIAKKKKELENIEASQMEVAYTESQAEKKARLKAEKDRIRKLEQELETQVALESAKHRQKDAVRWLEQERTTLNFKKTQANHLRTAHCVSMRKDRKKADDYSQQQEKHKKQQQKKQLLQKQLSVDQYIQGLNVHGIHKRPPNSFSNPNIVIQKQNEEDQNLAAKRAESQQEKMREIERNHSEKQELNRKKAVERGEEALNKMRKQKQYQDYCQQVAEDQLKYNMRRIAAGQKNQYTGIKPMTLSQIQANKKLRGQQEFEQMFFKGKKISSKNQIVTKYGIVENKMKEIVVPEVKKVAQPKKPIDYRQQESLIPGMSEGHYSFEEEKEWSEPEPEPIQERHQYKYHVDEESSPERQEQDEPKPIIKETNLRDTKGNAMKQTRIPGASGPRGELNYSSQSQEDSNI